MVSLRRLFSTRPASFAGILLLAAVMFHAMPFTPQPVPLPFFTAEGEGESFFELFPVCDDGHEPDGFQADNFWLSDMPDLVTFGRDDAHLGARPDSSLPTGFSASIFRPPRFSRLRSLAKQSG